MGGDVRLERCLVVAEACVAVDAIQRDARIRHELGREPRKVAGKAPEQLDHRPADVLLVVVFAGAEPFAVVVAFQGAQERERLPGKRRGHPSTIQSPAMPSVLTEDTRTALVADLRGILGDRCTTNPTQLLNHSHGESYHPAGDPDVVVFPIATDEVSAVMKAAARHGSPVVPFGIGSALEGHVNAISGGVTIDLSRMNRVLRVSVEDLDATVEAGVTHRQLNKALVNAGVHFWVDPGADATIGGMAATRASGTTAVRYGTMREAVLGLTVVLADGRVIRTGGRARKSASGYDLTRLFVGSEGTLGVITDVTVRLHGFPEAVSAAVCPFQSMEGAVQTVITTIQLGIPVARIELLDEVQLDAVNRYSRTNYPLQPTLFFEFHGTSKEGVEEHARSVEEIAAENGAAGFQWALTTEATREAVARPAHGLLRRRRAPARRQGLDDRRLRAHLAPRRMHPRDEGGSAAARRSPRPSSVTSATATST